MKEAFYEIDIDSVLLETAPADRVRTHEKLAALKARVEFLRSIPYSDYLQTAHWENRRKAALKLASFACETCNAKEKLEVHHQTYQRLGCEIPSDLKVLCRNCHQLHHDIEAQGEL